MTLTAPEAVVLEPGHTGWVVGDEAAVLVRVDAGAESISRLGLASVRHTCTN